MLFWADLPNQELDAARILIRRKQISKQTNLIKSNPLFYERWAKKKLCKYVKPTNHLTGLKAVPMA